MNRVFHRLALSTLALSAVQWAAADPVDDLVEAQMKAGRAPGLSLVVLKDGKVVKRHTYGVMNLESKVPTQANAIFETGSIGKAFTATLVMQLVHEGKMNLDAPISTYVKECPEKWKDITIRLMLTQQSGLPEYALIPGIGLADIYTREQWFAGVSKPALDFTPGTMFQYSNTNFALLGYAIETVTGQPYAKVVAERIFKPSGMKDTNHLSVRPDAKRLATGYLPAAGTSVQAVEWKDWSGSGADGAFSSTPDDLLRFVQAIESGKLLPKATADMMRRSATSGSGRNTGYGFGWFVRSINGKRMISHGGNSVGYSASVASFPESGLTIALMSNVYGINGDGLSRQIAELYDPELAPKHWQPRGEDPHPKLTAWLIRGAKALAENKVQDAPLDPDFSSLLKTGRGQMMRAGFAVFRNLKDYAFLFEEKDGIDRILRYRASDGTRTFAVTFVVNAKNELVAMGARPE